MLEVESKFIVEPTRCVLLRSLLIKGEVQSSGEWQSKNGPRTDELMKIKKS